MRISFILSFLLSVILFSCQAQVKQTSVKTGIDVLIDQDFAALKGKRVGLITNPTGVNRSLKSTIDIFHESRQVDLKVLYGPEHGVRGNYKAGEKVYFKTDPKTGLPVYSLYGKNRKPSAQMLQEVDILVYDIQDIGVRSYTYISSMGLAMEAAAENDIEFMVLDRPNPLGGLKIEGNIAEENLFSLVGAYPIPYVYGLTCGELAKMINKEGWLKDNKQCKLSVIEMESWERSMLFKDCDLSWVPSSPHIPKAEKAPYYVATGILGELGIFNIGVGYTLPFELFATDYLNPNLLVEKLNKYYEGNVLFRPITFKAFYGKDADKQLHGVQVHIIHPEAIDLISIQFKFLEVFHQIYPNIDIYEMSKDRHNMLDKVLGSSIIRKQFFEKYKYDHIKTLFEEGFENFKDLSSKYYLY